MRAFATSSQTNFDLRRVKEQSYLDMGLRFGPVSLSIFTIFLLCVLSLFYLTNTNSVAIKGYEFKELEQKIQSLRKENKKLQLESIELQSIQRIEKEAEKLKMEEINKVSYTSPKDGGSKSKVVISSN